MPAYTELTQKVRNLTNVINSYRARPLENMYMNVVLHVCMYVCTRMYVCMNVCGVTCTYCLQYY